MFDAATVVPYSTIFIKKTSNEINDFPKLNILRNYYVCEILDGRFIIVQFSTLSTNTILHKCNQEIKDQHKVMLRYDTDSWPHKQNNQNISNIWMP